LESFDRIPLRLSELQKYFDRSRALQKGGPIYVSAYLGHELPFAVLNKDIKDWMDDQGYGWYLKALQVERSAVVGWLLYSTRDMDLQVLADKIFELVLVRTGLRWRPITVPGGENLPADRKVSAIHVEVDRATYIRDKAKIQDLYSATRTGEFPLGIKFRLVPQSLDIMDPRSAAKLDLARLRQASFLANVQRTGSDDIGGVDYEDERVEWTLRSLIMSIKSVDGKNLFVSVDKHFRGSGVMFQFTSRYYDEAMARINGMLPFLKTMVPMADHICLERHFTPEAIMRSQSCTWDPVAMCVVSLADQSLAALVSGWESQDDEYNFPGTNVSAFEFSMEGGIQPSAQPPQGEQADSDSISTFASRRRNKRSRNGAAVANTPTNQGGSGGRAAPPASSANSVATGVSFDSLNSRMSAMENSIAELSSLRSVVLDLAQLIRAQSLPSTGPPESGQAPQANSGTDAGGNETAGAGQA
jgi:hypothetical protein